MEINEFNFECYISSSIRQRPLAKYKFKSVLNFLTIVVVIDPPSWHSTLQ